MYKFRKPLFIFWIVFVICTGMFASKLPSVLGGSGFEMDGSYSKTEKILQDEFKRSPDTYIILFEKKKNQSKKQFEENISKTMKELNRIKGIKKISSPLENNYQRKEKIAYATVNFKKSNSNHKDNIEKINKSLNKIKEINVSLTGGPVIEQNMNESSQSDLKQAETIGLPIALIVLILAFSGLVAAGIPLISGGMSVASTMGILYFIGQKIEMSVFVLNVVPMIGLALSIDFALLYINRFREELNKNTLEEAISITTKTAGRAIGFSGLCVILGLSGLLFIHIDIFRSVAIGGICVVLISVLMALTFLPALLSLLGNNINRLKILKIKEKEETSWKKFAKKVMKRPIIVATFGLIILSVGIVPIKNMHLEIPDASALPSDNEARKAFEKFEDNFINKNESQVVVIIKTKRETKEKQIEEVEKFIEKLEKDKKVIRTESIFSVTKTNSANELNNMIKNPQTEKQLKPAFENFMTDNYALINVVIKGESSSKQSKNWVRALDKKEMPSKFTIGGYSKFNQEIFDEIYHQGIKGLIMILATTYFILMMAFRSVVIPLKAIVMNLFSFGSAFGIIVWIFQEGHLNIEPSAIGLMIPVLAFAVVFGLSMDYEVFLISRIHEIYKETHDNDTATLEGLASTSKIITSAAAIMIVVTGAFAFTDIIPVKQIGIGIALSIFIDATIIRMLLVPSLMKLLGDWNWWFPIKKKK